MTSFTSFWDISVKPFLKSLALLPAFHPESLHCYLSHDCLHSLSFLFFPSLHFSPEFPQPCPTILPVLKFDNPSFLLHRKGWQSVVKCKSCSTLDTWPSITSSHCTDAVAHPQSIFLCHPFFNVLECGDNFSSLLVQCLW